MENISHKEWLSKPRIVCGIMSGTSVDGIDTALVKFWQNGVRKHEFKLLAFECFTFSEKARDLIFKILKEPVKISEISELNFLLSKEYANAVVNLCNKNNLKLDKIDAVGVHGQTVWHEPKGNIPNTLQLCSISALSRKLNLKVVGDFRAADIADGGEGAPLVPIFDYEFLAEPNKNVIALNIGGMANITFLPSNNNKNDVLAFDTGPGNVLIDSYMQKHFNKDFDNRGFIASKGIINKSFLNKLKRIDFINKKPPKSTGRESFNYELISKIINSLDINRLMPNDIIATLSYFTSWSIAENINRFTNGADKIIISGGGSYNSFILKHLKAILPDCEIRVSDRIGIPSDAKEAICFAYLAYRTLGGLTSNIKGVTGAEREVVLGVISQ